jgi:hypothetical protein
MPIMQDQSLMANDFATNDPACTEAYRGEAATSDLLRRYPECLTNRTMEDVARALRLSRTTL